MTAKSNGRVADYESGPSNVSTVTPTTATGPKTQPKTQTWTASDGTVFTDQGAFATYSTALMARTTAAAASSSDAATTAANAKIANQNAYTLLSSTLSGYGIDPNGAISSAILGLQQKNYDASTIQALIQDPASTKSSDPSVAALATAWNTRFSGNVTRIANGQNPLSPADYISTENSYRDILNAAGVPQGFYSSNQQLGTLIGGDIAPTELQDRVNTAAKSISNQDPFYTQTLQNYYGLTPGDMIAHALDPQTALPLLQRQQASATFGAAGARQDIAIDQNTANQYAALGVTQTQAEQGFQDIGTQLGTDQKLAAIYSAQGNTFGNAGDQQGNLVAATFGGASGADAALKLKNLQQQEVNAFSGSSGVDKNSLSGSSAGTF